MDKVLSQLPKKDYVSLVNSAEGAALVDQIKAYKFTDTDVDVPLFGKGTYAQERAVGAYDKQFVFKQDIDEIMEEMQDVELEFAYKDAAALSERMSDDYDFSKDFYLTYAQQEALSAGLKAGTQEFISFVNDSTDRFANTMRDDVASRSRVALASVLRAGTQLIDPLGPNWGRSNVKYNPVKARSLLKPAFNFDSNVGRFVTDLGYTTSSTEVKKKLYMTQLHSIFQSRNLDEGEKEQLSTMFLQSIPNPFGANNVSDIIQLYQDQYQPNYNLRYGNPELVDNINRGLLLGELLTERTENF